MVSLTLAWSLNVASLRTWILGCWRRLNDRFLALKKGRSLDNFFYFLYSFFSQLILPLWRIADFPSIDTPGYHV